MNFTEAIGYSFKGQNIPKILTIVLVFVITGVSILVASILLESVALLFVLMPVLLVYGLFVSGYPIAVIKSVMSDEDALPNIQLGRDLGRGALVWIASFVYMIPFFILFVIVFALLGATAPQSSSAELDASMLMVFCGAMIAMVVLGFGFTYSLLVGWIRYAAEDSAGALFNIPKNFGIVMSNIGTTLGLFVRQIGLGIVFGIFSAIVGNIIMLFFGSSMNNLAYVETADDLVSLGLPIAIFTSVYYVFSLTISLMQTLSSSHLIAGYGIDLGYGISKLKNDEASGGKNILLILLAVLFIVGFFACVVITILAIMGPVIGEVFSEVITGLE
ncbi:MAG: hypothetical protein Phog2KO_31130 [Phototrophicaceae bacterium]